MAGAAGHRHPDRGAALLGAPRTSASRSSAGSASAPSIAILAWILLSAAFGFYVGNFSSYDKTYGSLAGVIVFLLWLWITNLALLFGAELDAELERGRELLSGIKAEETVQLPPRDTRNIEKAEKKRAEDIAKGRELRLSAGHDDDPESDAVEQGSRRG